jgi:serine/threonine protein kinase
MQNEFPDALPQQHRLHWYVIERVLGQGGFGITYLSRDTNLDQPVAIKEYLPVDVAVRRPDQTVRPRTEDQGERYRWGLDRFIREARTLARFDHPNIVRVHSVFEVNNTAYMVMRYEEGETLAALLDRRQTLPEADLMRVLLPVLDGLQLVHEAGFIHRDIKPDNIHLRPDGSSVLLDFGSARHALGHARTITILVAPGYAPFEQYYSSGENQGPWTDIYSLGATCYRAIAGRPPMDAIARSKGILGSTKEMLVPAHVVGRGRYSERLLRAVDHALEFSEADRPQSIAEWRAELAGAAAAAVPPTRAARPGAKPAAPPSESRQALIWASAGAAAVIIAIAVVPRLGPTGTATPPAPVPAPPPEVQKKPDAGNNWDERFKQIEAQLKADEERRKREDEERRRREEQDRLEQLKRREEAEQARREEEARKRRERLERAAAPAPVAKPQPAPPKPVPEPPVVAEPKPAPEPALVAAAKPPAPVKEAPRDLFADAERAFAEGNEAEGIRLLLRAGESGDGRARMRLGELYGAGRYVTQDFFQAYVWYGAAQASGVPGAKVQKDLIAARLQPAEVQHAEKVVKQLAARRSR